MPHGTLGLSANHDQATSIGHYLGPWNSGLGGYYHRQPNDDDAASLTRGNRAKDYTFAVRLSHSC